MSKNKLNVIVDILTYVAMVGLAGTGLLLAYRLPPGSHGRAILGWGRHDWGDVHFYLAIGLVALAVLHLVLHWQWVTRCIGAAMLLVLGLVTAAALAAPFCCPLTEGGGDGCGEGAKRKQAGQKGKGKQAGKKGKAKDSDACSTDGEATPGKEGHGGGHAIRGRTTLAEAAEYAGVPLARLLTELRLPADTPPADHLGMHGFRQEKVAEVREIIERLRGTAAEPTPPEGKE